jgi:hypothetical protein
MSGFIAYRKLPPKSSYLNLPYPPLSPFPSRGRGEEKEKRGFKPLLNCPLISV